jgi:hypothetical protein
MEHWNFGTLELWNIGTLELWNIGTRIKNVKNWQ